MEDKREFLTDEEAVAESDNWLSQKIFNEVKEQVYQRGTFTVYIIHAVANEKEYEGVGFSKARPDVTINQYDPERGKKVARGRSVHDLFIEYNKNR
jgi:hypothetical protein